jgi:hypothetical protein
MSLKVSKLWGFIVKIRCFGEINTYKKASFKNVSFFLFLKILSHLTRVSALMGIVNFTFFFSYQ